MKLSNLFFKAHTTLIDSVGRDEDSRVQLTVYYYLHHIHDLKAILGKVMAKSTREYIELRKFTLSTLNSTLIYLDTDSTIYFLDWYLVSLQTYAALRTYFNFVNVLKHQNTIDKRRQKLNQQVINALHYELTRMVSEATAAPVENNAQQDKILPFMEGECLYMVLGGF